MQQILAEIYVYLSLYKGDFENVIQFLEAQPKTAETELALYKVYFGTQHMSY